MYFENIFYGKENLWQFNDFAKSAQIIHFRKFEHNKICMKIINIQHLFMNAWQRREIGPKINTWAQSNYEEKMEFKQYTNY